MRRAGFTLIELLLIIGLVSILGVMGAGVGGGMLGRNNVRVASDKLVVALTTARSYAMSGREDSSWGVRVIPGAITTYKGASYAARVVAWDEEYSLAGTVDVSSQEVVFTKIVGEATPASIPLSGPGGASRTVTVSALGLVEVQ